MPIKTVKNSFNAGELGPQLDGRTDLAKYYNGCSQMVNFTPLPQGGAVKRPGTEYIATGKGKCRLIPFEFSVTDAHVLEFGNTYMRVYKNGARVMETSSLSLVAVAAKNITVFADYSGTEAGTVLVTAVAHGLLTNDYTTIAGTTNYNGTFQITKVTADTFYITDTWVADDATGTSTFRIVTLPTGGNVIIGYVAHGYSTGNLVRFASVGGTTELNGKDYEITVISANSYTLDGTDGSDFSAWTSGGTTTLAVQITTPYDEDESFGFHYVQSADVMYLAHADVHPQKLSRLSDTSWTLADTVFTHGPFTDSNTDTTKTLTFTHYTGAHITTDNSASLIVAASTFVASTLVGCTVYNITDGSSATITANTATGVTGTLSGGTDNDWDIGDVYEIGTSENFYHTTDAVGVLSATGHDPFVAASHDGSLWRLESTRTGDNYATISGAATDGLVSSAIEVCGDFTVATSGFSLTAVNTLTLQRKTLQGEWQNDRKFTASTSYSATELETGVFYRLRYTGATAPAQFNATLTASNAVTMGTVEIIDVIDEDEAVVKVVDKVFITPTQSDVAFTNLNQAGTGIVTVLTTATVAAGDTIVFKGITNALYTHLNLDTGGLNYTVITATAGVDFTFYSGDETNLAADATGVGEFYVLGEVSTTSSWAEGSWSVRLGYPRTVNFHEDRLWWASTDGQPQTLWASQTSDYENMLTGVFDNEAIVFTLNDRDISQIQWLVSRTLLAIGTASKEYVLSASNPENPITPTDVRARNQSAYGSNTLQPVILNDVVFFHQRSGKKLRAMKFDFSTFTLSSSDATVLHPSLLELSATTMAAQKIPDGIIWLTRSDGYLLGFTYQPDEEVLGWSRHTTGSSLLTPVGIFESIARISGSVEDEIWVSVKRVINSATVRYVERFTTRFADQLDEAVHVDSALISTTGTDSKNINLASDTVRYGEGNYGSSYYGGRVL